MKNKKEKALANVNGGVMVNIPNQPNGTLVPAPGQAPDSNTELANPQAIYVPSYRMPTGQKIWRYVKRSIAITFKYLFAQLLVSIVMGFAAAFILGLFKVPMNWLLGAILGIGNMIPIVGQWISLLLVLLLELLGGLGQELVNAANNYQDAAATSSPDTLTMMAITFLVFVVLQVLEEFVLTPIIVGRSMRFKPILVLLITIVAGAVFGNVWGLILAVPVAAVIKLGFDIFYLKKDIDDPSVLK